MVAVLYRQREWAGEPIEAISAEDSWRDVIANWLLDDIIKLPLGKYIIVQGNIIATFELEELDNGTRFLSLTAHLDLDNIKEDV